MTTLSAAKDGTTIHLDDLSALPVLYVDSERIDVIALYRKIARGEYIIVPDPQARREDEERIERDRRQAQRGKTLA